MTSNKSNRTAIKLAGFAVVLAAVFVIALLAGSAIGPDVSPATSEGHDEENMISTTTRTQHGPTDENQTEHRGEVRTATFTQAAFYAGH